MELPPFLLDQWIAQKNTANPPIEYDLASSTGPVWTLRELLALSPDDELEALLDSGVRAALVDAGVELVNYRTLS